MLLQDLLKSVARSAAFRHPTTGQVWEVGSFHDIDSVPTEHHGQVEAGYVDHIGKFLTNDQAKQIVLQDVKKSEAPASKEDDTILDGVLASEAIDKSGEVMDIEGCDITEFDEGKGLLNYEHKDTGPQDVIGKILYAKKIFSAKDCTNDRQRKYWDDLKLPMIYGIVRLADGSGHPGAIAAAARIRDDIKHDEPSRWGFSIEGTTIKRDTKTGRLLVTIAKRCALTFKPCNESAATGLIYDPGVKSDLFRTAPSDASVVGGEDLVKTFDAAPSQLTGTAALATEDLGIKGKLRRALKKWDRKTPLKAFLKMQMPEADPSYIDNFADMTERYTIRKAQELALKKHLIKSVVTKMAVKTLKKNRADAKAALVAKMDSLGVELLEELQKADQPKPIPSKVGPMIRKAAPPEPETVKYNGRTVKPGFAIAGEGNNKQHLRVLEHTPEHLIAVPKEKIGGWQASDLLKLPRNKVPGNIWMTRPPEYVGTPAVIDSKTHGLVNYTHHPEVHALIHGLDMGQSSKAGTVGMKAKAGQAAWMKNAAGKHVYVKRDDNERPFGESKREALYHNLAKDFYGMGKYVTPTAAVIHPTTGQHYTVVEHTPGEHFKHGDGHPEMLQNLAKSGELHKLAIMNGIAHNNDRHQFNYLLDNGNMKLIDHGLAFSGGGSTKAPMTPHYMYGGAEELPVHPEAQRWLQKLKPAELERQMNQHGVPPEFVQEASRRLQAMQSHVQANPKAKLYQALNSPFEGGTK